ncbi:hypothetical protein HMPREF9566_01275 [Cutibacterium acnes HL045PA1]|nr:hypothetical protein HMPREF9567_01990 [Cutibacterium acnes HL013PA1]EFS68708.1 hypothetical protein HMPREF9616_01525 [Cutibacterium acnes HL007PA1]EFT20897.1 hypothetical protein HMPREF9566_01275 [Cutibacterium acnes HL045PA1]EFT55396.1 hypothetical protein HMPREF9610_01655 [Cutibacterium acnes HL027PA2]
MSRCPHSLMASFRLHDAVSALVDGGLSPVDATRSNPQRPWGDRW